MATSGTRSFALSQVDIFEEAYERATGEELRHGYQVQSIRRSLNLLLVDWQNRGYNLWQLANSQTYALPNNNIITLDTSCVDVIEVLVRPSPGYTTLATSINNSQTNITLTEVLAPTSTFTLVVETEEMTVTAGFGTVNITVTRGTSPTAHIAGASAFLNTAGTSESGLDRLSVPDYARIADKTITSIPTGMLVRRENSPVVLTVYPVPDKPYIVSYWHLQCPEDSGYGYHTPDVSLRFVPALTAGLAFYIAAKTPKAYAQLPFLEQQYESALTYAQNEDRDKADLYIVPAARSRR